MTLESQKLEIIEWVSRLNNSEIIKQILDLRNKENIIPKGKTREFGSGKHLISYIADDFDDPLDDFKEYME